MSQLPHYSIRMHSYQVVIPYPNMFDPSCSTSATALCCVQAWWTFGKGQRHTVAQAGECNVHMICIYNRYDYSYLLSFTSNDDTGFKLANEKGVCFLAISTSVIIHYQLDDPTTNRKSLFSSLLTLRPKFGIH